MDKCIFCLKELNDETRTIEHIFPDAIGGKTCISTVCKECNDKLGRKVDSLLCNDKLLLIQRHNYGIKGKSGKIPAFFPKVWEVEDSDVSLYSDNILAPKIKKFFFEDHKSCQDALYQFILRDKKSTMKKLKTIFNDHFGKELTTENINKLADDLILKHSCKFEEVSINAEINRAKKLTGYVQLRLIPFFEPLIKIGYEALWYFYHDLIFDDPFLNKYRDFFRLVLNGNNNQEPIHRFYDQVKIEYITVPVQPIEWQKEKIKDNLQTHLICNLVKHKTDIWAYIHILNTYLCRFILSNNEALYDFDKNVSNTICDIAT